MHVKMVPHCGECNAEIPKISYVYPMIKGLKYPSPIFIPQVCPNCNAKIEDIVSDAIIEKERIDDND